MDVDNVDNDTHVENDTYSESADNDSHVASQIDVTSQVENVHLSPIVQPLKGTLSFRRRRATHSSTF
jgi:hypothetical protein